MTYNKYLKRLIINGLVPYNDIISFINNNDVNNIEFYENDMDYTYNVINNLKEKDISFSISSYNNLDSNIYDKSSIVKEDIIKKFSSLEINEKIYFSEFVWDVSSYSAIRLDYIIKAYDFYNKIAKDIETYDFSTYEKYIATHMLVQKYSEYNNGKNEKGFKNSELSKNPLLLIDEEQIVCVGYAGMENIILNKLGIDSEIILCGKDGYPHVRCIVEINDEKYNIHGSYMSDPTFDSKIFFNLLNNKKNKDIIPYFTSSVFMNRASDMINRETGITYGVVFGLTDENEALFTSANNDSIKRIASLSDNPIDEKIIDEAMYKVTLSIYGLKNEKAIKDYLKMSRNYCEKYNDMYLEQYNINKR